VRHGKEGSGCGYHDFNPRTRMGCDLTSKATPRASQNFNPRTRMGCDAPANGPYPLSAIFQSTHPHGVRLSSADHDLHVRDFNPRTRMGCDNILSSMRFTIQISIHAPAWGAT